MSLYDDYKKETGKKSETTVAPIQNQEVVSQEQEVYQVLKDPFYKRKEFYILCSTIIAVIAVVGLLLYTPSFEMEDLTGKDEEYADTFSDNYKLSLKVTEEFNDDYSRDQIYEQSLKAGETFKEGIVLEVKISKGPDYDKKLDLPDFEAMTYEEAINWKEENKAIKADIKSVYNDSIEEGTYIEEDISDDVKQDFTRNSEYSVTYSRGESPDSDIVKIEDMSGKSTAEAAVWAYNNGITLVVVEMFDDYLPAGSIIDQNKKPGEKVEIGSEFEVTVCVGPGSVVPNFYGLSKTSAMNEASKAGVVISERSIYASSTATGNLISQSVAAGTKIGMDDTVELVYSLGKVPISNYEGQNYIDVVSSIDMLNEAGARITIKTNYIDIPEPPKVETPTEGEEGEDDFGMNGSFDTPTSGTIESHTYSNQFVSPGTTITFTIYK